MHKDFRLCLFNGHKRKDRRIVLKVIRQRFLLVQDCLLCQNGLLKYCGATVTIHWSLTLHGQNELRGNHCIAYKQGPIRYLAYSKWRMCTPEPCRPMPAHFHTQGLGVPLSPCVLQPYFTPDPMDGDFKRECFMRTHSLVALLKLC